MKLHTLVVLLGFCDQINTLSIPRITNLFGLVDEYHPNVKETKLLSRTRQLYGNLDDSHDPEIVELWSDLEIIIPENFLSALNNYRQTHLVRITPPPIKQELQLSRFEHVQSERFPNHQLRINRNDVKSLGIDTVDQVTGYLDVDEHKHFFYWFFESRNEPKNDPLIIWLNGGPGCSSLNGLFFEVGPSFINSKLEPVRNPYSWNNNASVLFIDQPMGTGFSYSTGASAPIFSTDAASKDFYAFLELFFIKFPRFRNNGVHIVGESFAGHYSPRFASEILSHPDRTFKLSSILIGNGLTDPLFQMGSLGPMACGKGGYKQVIPDEKCNQLDDMYKSCARLIEKCYKSSNVFTCVPAEAYCSKLLDPYKQTGLSLYDIRTKCSADNEWCINESDYTQDYLNLPRVQDALGVDPTFKFESCSESVQRKFFLSGENMKPFQQYVSELLDVHDLPVLVYAGDKDYICNWLGVSKWTNSLQYGNHIKFAVEDFQDWVTKDGEFAGEVKNYDKFTFLRIYDAGHMVPYDQQKNSLDMVNRWIAGDFGLQE